MDGMIRGRGRLCSAVMALVLIGAVGAVGAYGQAGLTVTQKAGQTRSPSGADAEGIAWSTYIGGTDDEDGRAVVVDDDGNCYVTGSTTSDGWVHGGDDEAYNSDFPWFRFMEAFLVKLSPSGAHVWSTYIGGANHEIGNALALDSAGNVVVAGTTYSPDFLTTSTATMVQDAFVAKLSPQGAWIWGKRLGGGFGEDGNGLAVDGSNNIYIAGSTFSAGWVSGGFETRGPSYSYTMGFLAKLSPAGGHLWSTYVGTSSNAYAVAVDRLGNSFTVGTTSGGNWFTGFFNPAPLGNQDGYVIKISPAGQPLWGSYLGGNSSDTAHSVAVDSAGDCCIVGGTTSAGWTSGGYDITCGGTGYGNSDGFAVKLSAAGRHLWSTYLGGSTKDNAYAATIDDQDNIYVAGSTIADGWVSGGQATVRPGSEDGFVVKLSPAGYHLWSTYLGGAETDIVRGIAAGSAGNLFVAGYTTSPNWVAGVYDTVIADTEAFLVCIAQNTGLTAAVTPPQAAAAGAQWRRKGTSTWKNPGQLEVGLAAGNHTVEFKPLGGWATPADQTVAIGAGQTVEAIGAYSGSVGSLSVTLNPAEAVAAGMRWRRTGTINWYRSGETETGITPGTYQVEFSPLFGWTTPPFKNVTIAAGQIIYTGATYYRTPGEVTWGTYLGGGGDEACNDMAIDGSGNIYLTGYTISPGWLTGGWDTTHETGHYDAFVIKLSAAGAILWGTYLGGSGADYGYGVAIRSGECIVAGETGSAGWAAMGYDTSMDGSRDGFVARLRANGTHVWSTYLGGRNGDACHDVAVDPSGNICVAGEAISPQWASGGYDTTQNGATDSFVAKLTGDGKFLWSTYLGGPGHDYSNGIAVDGDGYIAVTGKTYSAGWTRDGWDTSLGAEYDGYVVRLTPAGQHAWSTYLGGTLGDVGTGVAIDHQNNVCVTGYTSSGGWVSGGFRVIKKNPDDAFVVKLYPGGQHAWSTYVGGDSSDHGLAIAADPSGDLLVSGMSERSTSWVEGGVYTTSPWGYYNGYVARLSANGLHQWSTYLGGNTWDEPHAIALDPAGNIVVAGNTRSSNWATGTLTGGYKGGLDVFVTRLRNGQPPATSLLQVWIQPVAALAQGARWRVAGTGTWRASGDSVKDLAEGPIQVEFNTIPYWDAPTTAILYFAEGRINSMTGTYRPRLEVKPLTPLLAAVKPGQGVTMAVTASGLQPITMQWRRNGAPITGAGGTTLQIDACKLTDEAVYSCVVSNPHTTVESPPFQVMVGGGSGVLAYLLGLTSNSSGLNLNHDGFIDIADVITGNKASLGTPAGPSPAAGATGVSRTPVLDWDDTPRAGLYDVYVWRAGTARPVTPAGRNLRASQCSVTAALKAQTRYNWQVEARREDAATKAAGPMWTFTTN